MPRPQRFLMLCWILTAQRSGSCIDTRQGRGRSLLPVEQDTYRNRRLVCPACRGVMTTVITTAINASTRHERHCAVSYAVEAGDI